MESRVDRVGEGGGALPQLFSHGKQERGWLAWGSVLPCPYSLPAPKHTLACHAPKPRVACRTQHACYSAL
ncbi:hypothetical protein F751_4112 [Auxenochlorella protothecoides]|uniref:Uncharacterized protein n=1 Tax=Auxenochlorella protothecoides TaxID=3075 RepID=A0A087ST94_AUXPR|nr:hypothetical protein F751_4112 [Auxenochlorella protothecoides]KFM28948.1 hypothetical protein F751_4112 [Auxenochlorella protothecoides]